MPPYFYQEVNMTEKKVRARTKKGHYKADDPSTPDVNEAYVQEEKPKKAEPTVVWFESRQPEPSMFDVAGLRSIRRYSDNHLEWKVMSDDVARFEKDHFIMNGRVRRKAVEYCQQLQLILLLKQVTLILTYVRNILPLRV